MAALVVVDANEGSLSRYEIGGECARLTHACSYGEPVTFTPTIVEGFRVFPPDHFAIDLCPQPPPSPRGGVAMREAA